MFSYRLKELRNKKNGLTQAKLAEVMNVSQQAVGLWERGKNMPSHELVAKLASFFNVSVDYLLGRTDEPQGTGFQKGLLGDINGDSPLAQKAREDNKESPRIEKALQEYRDILSNHDGHVACKQMKAFYKKHLNDNEFFEALAKHTPMDGGLTRRERNMLAHYRIVDEDTKAKIEERTKELVMLYMFDENNNA
ncbi:helix-turn-helix transcriptional regulator [Selenomonas sp. AE3005]|uniref:helix-turn-helix domain-containing protein n=1 Tax=Selenomonas sp. AE3005 TaxID=1485543 RepID=UPI0025FA45FA|nr:helix-turn-helix transcriptional regulator [Selenomonas sp. AE3005]